MSIKTTTVQLTYEKISILQTVSKAANPLYLEEEKPAPLLDTETMCVKFLTMPRNAILAADVLGHIL